MARGKDDAAGLVSSLSLRPSRVARLRKAKGAKKRPAPRAKKGSSRLTGRLLADAIEGNIGELNARLFARRRSKPKKRTGKDVKNALAARGRGR